MEGVGEELLEEFMSQMFACMDIKSDGYQAFLHTYTAMVNCMHHGINAHTIAWH